MWTPEEQREHRKLWLEALRSGRYQQCTSWLNDGAGMCCMGVACDISQLGSWRSVDGTNSYLGEAEILPLKVRDWLGLDSQVGEFFEAPDAATRVYLTDLNDGGKTFAEIAVIIESAPTGLVV